jgi:hypothetical protein
MPISYQSRWVVYGARTVRKSTLATVTRSMAYTATGTGKTARLRPAQSNDRRDAIFVKNVVEPPACVTLKTHLPDVCS